MQSIKDEFQEWKAKHKDLEDEKERTYQEMVVQ